MSNMLRALCVPVRSYYFDKLRKKCEEYGIEIKAYENFYKQRKGLNDVMIENSSCSGKNLKKRILKDKILEEKDYKKFILGEYTFLKRPVVISNDKIFIGSDKKNIEALKKVIK